jgi:hypothetical protein
MEDYVGGRRKTGDVRCLGESFPDWVEIGIRWRTRVAEKVLFLVELMVDTKSGTRC